MCKFYSTFWDEGLKTAAIGKTNAFILSDSNLPQEYLEQVVGSLSSQVQIYSFSLKGGEQIKTLPHADKLYGSWIRWGLIEKRYLCV